MAEEKLEEVMGEVEYLISYEAAAPALGRSEGDVQERVSEFVWIFEEERLEIVLGAWVSGAWMVVKVLSSEMAKLPEASFDFTR